MENSTDMPTGLTSAEARARLQADGFNELPRAGQRTTLRIILEVLREPMLFLLIGGGIIYLVLGDLTEALLLLVFACMSVVITVVQEARTERVLEALRDLTSPRAVVIRDGERQRIAGRDVVRGDLIVLGEGDRVPADATLLEGHDLLADESLLTGESVPVQKSASAAFNDAMRPGGDGLPLVFSGSLIVRGHGSAEVTRTGIHSEIGKIGQSLQKLEIEPPHLQQQTRKLVRLAAVLGGIVSLIAVVLYGTLRGNWLEAVLAGIALGMSMLPEEFPVVLTVFMAMGAWRIAGARVLTRRAAAIETLGSATVLCTDKTGTLTENRMTIRELQLPDGTSCELKVDAHLPEAFAHLATLGLRASAVAPVDPMDKAFHTIGNAQHGGEKLHSYGLRPDLLAVANVWQDGKHMTVTAKGAPEAIHKLCHLNAKHSASLKAAVNAMAARGLRVLAIASAKTTSRTWPDTLAGYKFTFAGLAGLADPIRATVPAAVEECRAAGIRVVMITGDYPVTAAAIAHQAGIASDIVITGEELQAMGDTELAERLRTATVFARIMPEQKLRIVNALKVDGEITAMTGDGVNDAPSLKAAHIGIAMGGRGTDVAREASSIVLLDDDFGSVVKAVKLGRRIYDNLQKAVSFIFAVHVPIAGLAILPLILGLPIILGPIHIAFLEMVIDPVCSLVFEAEHEEDNIMQRPPRSPRTSLFSSELIVWSLIQGAVAFALVATITILAVRQGMPENEVRALAFFALVTAISALIFVNRSFSASPFTAFLQPSKALMIVLAIVASILGTTLFWPAASNLFQFGPLHGHDLAVTTAAGIAVLLILELAKAVMHRLQPAHIRNEPSQ
jgi:P-type Ca2+ transporter type 2C